MWPPARLAPAIRETLDGYERGKQGPGQHSFAELPEATRASLIRFAMRDSHDETEQGYAEWKAIRGVRLVSEPLSDYMQWEHACTGANIDAGGYPTQ